ncbi:hypothetical protein D3C71_1618180 [compost metagenome]
MIQMINNPLQIAAKKVGWCWLCSPWLNIFWIKARVAICKAFREDLIEYSILYPGRWSEHINGVNKWELEKLVWIFWPVRLKIIFGHPNFLVILLQ